MSAGLKTLLEAAQFIEQQEKFKLSPQAGATPTIFNVHASSNTTTPATPIAYTNNNSSLLNRNRQNHVSASAPTAGATFTHVNGLSNGGNGGGSNGQLSTTITTVAAANQNHNQQHDYDYTIGLLGNGRIAIGMSNGRATHEDRMSEDEYSSDTPMSNSSTPNVSDQSAATFESLPPTIETAHDNAQMQHEQEQQQQRQQQVVKHVGTRLFEHMHKLNNNTTTHIKPTTTTNTTIVTPTVNTTAKLPVNTADTSNSGNNNKTNNTCSLQALQIVGNAAATKQMLLNGGIRIAAPTTTAMSVMPLTTLTDGSATLPNGCKSMLVTAVPASKIIAAATHGQRQHTFKSLTPLTPPPMSSRKFIEPNSSTSRIRSYSLSSQKITANQHLQLQQSGNASGTGNGNQHMLVDDAPIVYANVSATAAAAANSRNSSSSSSSNHSPPRSSGSHYVQMLQQQGAGSHVGATLSGGISGRRRTISSNSNGAGTREVHNKLEKNRRAHLKECYEALKNELHLKDEDRKKTSNLAILGEAYRNVVALQKKERELEAEVEKLAKEKINSQKRFNTLKRELGPKYEQIFAGIFPDIELGSTSIPSERETLNDASSLSSGRGSILYSSSSSLSSGGSNTMSSPVGAGLQTAMPTAVSPVICKANNNNNNNIIINNNNSTSVTSPTSSPMNINNSNNILQQLKTLNGSPNAAATAAVAMMNITNNSSQSSNINNSSCNNTNNNNNNSGNNTNNSSLPLSLTAKNISATSITRGSPTPPTPSPSPSSSSGVSSSSSLMSSSPPMVNGGVGGNGVMSGRNSVTVNIPNGLKFQTNAGLNGVAVGVGGGATIGNGTATAAATIIATAAPGSGANNNAYVQQQQQAKQQIQQEQQQQLPITAITTANTSTIANNNSNNNINNNNNNNYNNNNNNSSNNNNTNHTNSSIHYDNNNNNNNNKNYRRKIALNQNQINNGTYDEPTQAPAAKLLKVQNGNIVAVNGTAAAHVEQTQYSDANANTNGNNYSHGKCNGISQYVSASNLILTPTTAVATAITTTQAQAQTPKSLITATAQQSDGSASIGGRLPGGAEYNILTTIKSAKQNNNNNNNNITNKNAHIMNNNNNNNCSNGHKNYQQCGDERPKKAISIGNDNTKTTTTATTTTTTHTTTYYHANGKLTLYTGNNNSNANITNGNANMIFKDINTAVDTSSTLNGIKYAGNIAQLIAAATAGSSISSTANTTPMAATTIVPPTAADRYYGQRTTYRKRANAANN